MNQHIKIQQNVSLAQYTTLKIGGNAKYFFRSTNETELIDALQFARERGLSVFILGGGSNVLIADAGFDGLVIHIAMDRSELRLSNAEAKQLEGAESENQTSRRITAGAGENWDDFVAFCVQNDLAGVECLSGIPGSVGGTPVQNVGAYGQEVSETIVAVRCLDRELLKPVTLTNAECGFSYRKSMFNSTENGRYIVCDVTFELRQNGEPRLAYKDLIEYFGGRQPDLQEVRDAVLKIRRSKSMVIDSKDPNSQSAGSFFKNPIVTRDQLAELQTKYENMPFFEFGESAKIPAAWLIEKSGFQKGFALGNAGISTNHTLALVNRGGASATEILSLKTELQEAVETKFGVSLQPEPVFVGF